MDYSLHDLKVNLNVKPYLSSIELDGKKLRGVQSITISHDVNGVPEVIIKMICNVDATVTTNDQDIHIKEIDND